MTKAGDEARPARKIAAMGAPLDITITQGDDYARTYSVRDSVGQPRDLSTGYAATMQIREDYADFGAPLLLELNDDEGGIVLENGSLTIYITADQSTALGQALAHQRGRYARALYDLELTDTSTEQVERLLGGRLLIDREVTR